MPEAMINGAIIGGLAGGLVVILITLLRAPVKCEKCGHEQPKFRKPTSFGQAMWGGYTCSNCGGELNAKGKLKA